MTRDTGRARLLMCWPVVTADLGISITATEETRLTAEDGRSSDDGDFAAEYK